MISRGETCNPNCIYCKEAEESMAEARLARAAPDLLAALERADDNFDTLAENLKAGLVEGALSLVESFCEDARAAISRARIGTVMTSRKRGCKGCCSVCGVDACRVCEGVTLCNHCWEKGK